ncbi:MAG: Na+/H+ antiporter subunit A [Propionibacteriales bacterium]|nr:Na+/H+ antiporter subunit A [Propionibacteriales bacterium]
MLLIAVHFGCAILAPWVARALGNRMYLVMALPPAITFGWLVWQGPTVLAGGQLTETYPWISGLGIDLAFRMGTLQWVLGLVVSGIGALVLFHARWYFADDTPRSRCAGALTAFAGTMLGLVTADNFVLLYVFWELTTVLSYLLIGHNPRRSANRLAALNALIVTTFGGLAMLVGILVLGAQAGTYTISEVLTAGVGLNGWSATTITALLLIIVGALTKSAMIPFHFWLPGAMAAPTPVSAYLHAAAMVKAGVYLIALLAPAFAAVPGWRPVLLTLGAATMVAGGWRALSQNDIKLLLAYGTVSQLGFMMVLGGLGTRTAALAAVAVVIAHALFKSTLFLVVGIVDHSTGTRDLRKLSRVGRHMPFVCAAAVLAGASMAGVPPLLGFLGKEVAFESMVNLVAGDLPELTPAPTVLLAVAVLLGSAMTVAYTLRFLWGAFGDKRGSTIELKVARVPWGFALSPVLLGLLCLVGGFFGPQLTAALDPYVATVTAGAESHGMKLWGGFTIPLGMSGLAMVAGVGLFLVRHRVTRVQAGLPVTISAEELYGRVMRGVDRLAVEVTAITQRGSLPLYLGIILLTLVALPGGTLLLLREWPERILWWDTPAQAIVGLVVAVAAIAAVAARGRLKAVILVGVTGYGTAMMFLLHGAPDLALTQVLVETVMLIVFVLVMRKLPKYFTERPLHASRWWRMVVAVLTAVVVCALTFVAAGSRVATPVSQAFAEAAYTFGYGKNIVNVTLVDIRSWDTMGEISVLVVAATGVASLIFIRTRHGNATNVASRGTATHQSSTGQRTSGRLSWLRGGESLSPVQRSIIFEVATRLLFPVMILISVYLLAIGHNEPGGGFAGGLIAGLALVIRYLAGGANELDEAAPVDAGRLLGIGLLIAGLSALAPVLFGGRILQSYALDFSIPVLSELVTPWGTVPLMGEFHLVTSVFFDIAVYLVVIGVLLDIARSLGAGIDQHEEEDRAPAPRAGSDRAISGVRRFANEHPETAVDDAETAAATRGES